uniref:SAM domain-containing protein n=1 Tax=Anopheles atroparvus TaxID=41427 RepID=A0A182IZF5_ANOAO
MEQKESENEDNCISTEYYDPVAIVLSSLNYNTENLTDNLRKCAVTYDQLSGLVEEDLRLMGMTKSNAIEEILAEISQLSNQKRMYDSVIRNEFAPGEYAQTVSKNSAAHLQTMNLFLNILQSKLELFFPNNILLEDTIYSSEWSLKLCDKINAKLNEIEGVIKEEKELKTTKISARKIGVSLILLSGAIALTICCTKRGPKLL